MPESDFLKPPRVLVWRHPKPKKGLGWWNCKNTAYLSKKLIKARPSSLLCITLHECIHGIHNRENIDCEKLVKSVKGLRFNRSALCECKKFYPPKHMPHMCWCEVICDLIPAYIIMSMPKKMRLGYDYEGGYNSATQIKKWLRSGAGQRLYDTLIQPYHERWLYLAFLNLRKLKLNKALSSKALDSEVRKVLSID